MIKIKSGVNNYFSYLLVLSLFLFSCEDNGNKFILEDNIFSIIKDDSINITIELYENGIIKNLISENRFLENRGVNIRYFSNGLVNEFFSTKDRKKHGEYLLYDNSGEILEKSNYIEGKKNGNTFEFYYDKSIWSQRVYIDGNAIYSGVFEDGKKIFNSPIPIFEKEVINTDYYEAFITFPFKFRGEVHLFLRDSIEFEKKYIDKYNIKLIINNFRSFWPKYELRLVYEPSENDTLINTEFVYNRNISSDMSD
jgi:antitoxin component YwqK of YwqJK toxin-antitoxin module